MLLAVSLSRLNPSIENFSTIFRANEEWARKREILSCFSPPREKSSYTFLLLAVFVASHLLTKRTKNNSQFSLDSHKDPGISASLMGSPALTASVPPSSLHLVRSFVRHSLFSNYWKLHWRWIISKKREFRANRVIYDENHWWSASLPPPGV